MNHSFPDKYTMTREDNVFLAKKYLKDSVYRSAHLEGLAVTFPQTEAILENAAVQGVSPHDIAKVFGLRDAWAFILDTLDEKVDLPYLQNLHRLIAREDVPWNYLGVLRTEQVRISGTSYLPPLPDASIISEELANILAGADCSATDRAIAAMLFVMRAQPFLDGNKRVGTMVANQIFISNGCGIFSVPPELKQEFATRLVAFYESGDKSDIAQLIYDNCLTGF